MMQNITKRRVMQLIFPAVLLVAMLSCLVPTVRTGWVGLLQKAGLVPFPGELASGKLYIHVLDVGKADAILVESPKAALLVDTGTEDRSADVIRYLEQRNITALDALWITHGDSDHAGGMESILHAVPAKEVIGSVYNTMPQRTKSVSRGERLTYGDLTLEVLAPIREYKAENDNSIVFRLCYGEFSMLFCGDIEANAEKDLLESGADLQADVLKAAHHGSDTSNSAELLEAVKAKYAVISAGEDRNLLPRNAVLKRLQEAGAVCYRTDLNGTVVIGTDGKDIEIITETAESTFGG